MSWCVHACTSEVHSMEVKSKTNPSPIHVVSFTKSRYIENDESPKETFSKVFGFLPVLGFPLTVTVSDGDRDVIQWSQRKEKANFPIENANLNKGMNQNDNRHE